MMGTRGQAKSSLGYVIVGVILLAFIPVAMTMVSSISSKETIENQPIENATGSVLIQEIDNHDVQLYADNWDGSVYEVVEETKTVEVLPSWILDLLQLLVPLGMGAGALLAFTKVVR